MRAGDVAEMDRRLAEVVFIAERGYEPIQASGELLLWVKCHAGKVLSHQKALEEIARDEGRPA